MDLGRKPPPATTRRVNQRRSIFLPKSTSPSKGAGKSLTNLWPNARLDELLPWTWAENLRPQQRAA